MKNEVAKLRDPLPTGVVAPGASRPFRFGVDLGQGTGAGCRFFYGIAHVLHPIRVKHAAQADIPVSFILLDLTVGDFRLGFRRKLQRHSRTSSQKINALWMDQCIQIPLPCRVERS